VIDPPNYLASAIAVLQLTGSVINICYDYQSTVRHASKDMERIRQQLVNFRDVLEHLVSIVASEPHRYPALEQLSAPGGLLIIIEAELRTLETKLKPARGWRRKGQALVWPLQGRDVRKTLSTIESIKATIHLAQSVDQTYV
jgi:hypothetical protein